tara:strand:+ start:176 stop:397 length:222 start_codon:yes stop_codon:yes gene_type:complete
MLVVAVEQLKVRVLQERDQTVVLVVLVAVDKVLKEEHVDKIILMDQRTLVVAVVDLMVVITLELEMVAQVLSL